MAKTKLELRREKFLEALSSGASVTKAAIAAGVGRRTVYDWRSSNKAFAHAWAEAEQAGTDLIEDEARRRAVDGIDKPVFRGGEVVGYVTDYSDAMLTMLLKARRPEKYTQTKTRDSEDKYDFKGARETLLGKFSQILAKEEEC